MYFRCNLIFFLLSKLRAIESKENDVWIIIQSFMLKLGNFIMYAIIVFSKIYNLTAFFTIKSRLE